MTFQHTISRLAFSLLLVLLSSNLAWCGDREDIMQIAAEVRSAIERQDPEGILKHIQDSVCIQPECYTVDELRKLFADKNSWPNTMLFFGESSIHEYIQEKADIFLVKYPDLEATDIWQISLANPEISEPIHVDVYLSKRPSGWKIFDVHFY